MADRLHESRIILKDDVSPDELVVQFTEVVEALEAGAERRSLALDWNNFRIEFVPRLSGSDVGSLRVQASAPVL